uniref:Uncharacterized protein n=1 Tax=Glossina pallidipes TaxID=7398 RepID=A0A1A9ZIU9_GLOPL
MAGLRTFSPNREAFMVEVCVGAADVVVPGTVDIKRSVDEAAGILSPTISNFAVVILGVDLVVVVTFAVVAVVDKLILLSAVELVKVLPATISANCGDSTICILSPALKSSLTEVYFNASFSFKSLETVVYSYLSSLTSLTASLSIVGASEDVLNVFVTFSKSLSDLLASILVDIVVAAVVDEFHFSISLYDVHRRTCVSSNPDFREQNDVPHARDMQHRAGRNRPVWLDHREKFN